MPQRELVVKELPSKTRALVVTHDIDWPLHGPGTAHILARKDRFDNDIVRRVVEESFNPYYGIPKIMETEEKLGMRSTFFFRPTYDDGSQVDEYEKTIKMLLSSGWEVGLHSNNTATLEEVAKEKAKVEKAAGQPIYGSRIHYLRVFENTFSNLAQSGIKYDSSLCFNKKQIDVRNTGYLIKNGLIIFPIPFMDTYLFSYMQLTEEKTVSFVTKSVQELFKSGVQIVTLLWHDNSINMKGGRSYTKIMEQLTTTQDVKFLKGIEAFKIIQKAAFQL